MKINHLILFSVTILLFFYLENLIGQDSIPKRVYTTRAVENINAPIIDGFISEESWNLVPWSGNYIEWSPEENTAPTEQTKIKILYDDNNLYVAFKCYDTDPEGIVKRLSRRDGFDGEWVEINIDSYHDLRTAFSFTITVAGVKGEEFISNNGAVWDPTWNPIWYAKTNIDDEGWTAEIKIPFSQLRFGNDKDQIWGIQSQRLYFRKSERSLWQRIPLNAPGWVSEFGELHGLKNLKPQRQFELQPYAITSLKTYEAENGNPFRDGSDKKLNGGLDGKIGITNDLTVDFTINPDFGQVEADPSAIALDGFQIFFPEQRPFFIENKNIFDYKFSASKASLNTFSFDNLFYSRRIGRSPQGFPNLSSGDYFSKPNETTILGAAKLSGKTKDGWSIGVLESVTENEVATISNSGNKRTQVVEPLTNYFVSRIQKDFNNNNTFIGGIFTATNRNLKNNSFSLHKSAYTGGIDLTHQWEKRAWYLKGNFVFSNVSGSKETILNTQKSISHLFQRIDATYVEVDTNKTSLTGTGGNIQFGKASGNWRFETGATFRSPELELNDVGFQLQADDFRHYVWAQYRTTKPLEKVRSYTINFTHLSVTDFGGNLNLLSSNVNGWVNLKNNWWINGGVTFTPLKYSNFALRGGPRLKKANTIVYRNGIISDSRKQFRFTLNHSGSWGIGGESQFNQIGVAITYQPTNALSISFSPTYSINKDKLQYVTATNFESSARYINSEIKQTTLSFPIRVDYIITPNLSLQYWGQPFISKGRYSNFKRITNPVANEFGDRFSNFDDKQILFNSGVYSVDEDIDGKIDYTFGQPDFAFVQWRSNLVLRWEYIPGSELFLVWSQNISQLGNFNDGLFQSLDNNLLNTQPENIFLLKATYRFIN